MIKWRVLNAVAKKPVDVTPQIAKRAYELYENRGRQGRSSSSGLGAGGARSQSRGEAEAKAKPKPEAKAETSSDLTPGIVRRVHELYEELGRENVRAVQDGEGRSGRSGKINPINRQTRIMRLTLPKGGK